MAGTLTGGDATGRAPTRPGALPAGAPRLATPRRARCALAAAALLAALPGCASVGTWALARGRDLGDCARASLSLGAGLHAEVQGTSFLHPSVGVGDVSFAPRRSLGWDPRPLPAGRVRTDAFPVQLVAWPAYRSELTSLGYADTSPGWRGFLSPWILMGSSYVEGRSHSLFGLHRFIPNPLLAEPPESPSERWSRRSWLAAGGTLGVVQADAGVNPLEILDLLAGLAGFDPLGDDRRGSPVEGTAPESTPQVPAPAPPPPAEDPVPADPLQSEG